jgi:hypothetical protein
MQKMNLFRLRPTRLEHPEDKHLQRKGEEG